jgi:hypothetical protein
LSKHYVIILLLLAVLCAASTATQAVMATTKSITHDPFLVYQAYPTLGPVELADAPVGDPSALFSSLRCRGLNGWGEDVITAVPGILAIDPGTNWSNFVSAATAGVAYTVKNVVLRKVAPQVIQCSETFSPGVKAVQQGTPNIRLWWPLMYEIPGTTWTLSITYGTPSWADPANPGHPSVVHTDVWTWRAEADIYSVQDLLAVFHELPFGLDEVPIISDENLYVALRIKLSDIAFQLIQTTPDLATAGDILVEFEMEVADACITESPATPRPTGGDTGIANDLDNPACCKLLVDAEYVGFKYNIFQPSK